MAAGTDYANWDWDAIIKASEAANAPTPNLSYNDTQYSEDYEPNKDTNLSYIERVRLQMAKDEAIRDRANTMSIEDAMSLVGTDSLKGQDISGPEYKQAYDKIVDTFDNPAAMADMSDDQIIQLQRLGSSKLSGNMYDIATENGNVADYFSQDIQGLLSDAGREAVDRYGGGKFSEDYAGSPDAIEPPRVGAGAHHQLLFRPIAVHDRVRPGL
jgi:hypothetical protein